MIYYALFHDQVKIGTTTMFWARMSTLKPDEVLAVEPGDRSLEKLRHDQFRHCRLRFEMFDLNAVLIEHMRMLTAQHAIPPWPRKPRTDKGWQPPLRPEACRSGVPYTAAWRRGQGSAEHMRRDRVMSWGKKDKDDDHKPPMPFEPHRHTENSRTPIEQNGKIVYWNIWCECGIVYRTVKG